MNKFGELLAHYRRECRDPIKSGTLSQSALADLLSEYDERLIYSKTQVSNWETGKRKIPLTKRPLLIGLIYIFTTNGNMKELVDANAFLQSGGYAPLTEKEVGQLPEKQLFWKKQVAQSVAQSNEANENQSDSQTLLTIAGILRELETQSGDNEKLKAVLAEIESQRITAILNLSQTQRYSLEAIPFEETPLDIVFDNMHKIESLKDVRTKELNLRLHELRYLGLINRKRDRIHRWLYWQETPRSLFS